MLIIPLRNSINTPLKRKQYPSVVRPTLKLIAILIPIPHCIKTILSKNQSFRENISFYYFLMLQLKAFLLMVMLSGCDKISLKFTDGQCQAIPFWIYSW